MLRRWRRYLRLAPAIAWREFWHPILNRGQMMQGLIVVIGFRLALFDASFSERVVLATEWALWLQAFGIACVVWAVISAIRAPFVVRAEDAAKGRWHNHRFVYHEPLLVATERFEAIDGNIQRRPIRFDHAEPSAFVYFTIQAMPNVGERLAVLVQGTIRLLTESGEEWIIPYGDQFFGTRLPHDITATLLARLRPVLRDNQDEDAATIRMRELCRA